MQLVDLAFRERDDHHAREPQMLVEDRNCGLFAAYPVERLCVRRDLEQALDAGAQDHAVARYSRVAVGAGDLPALAFRMLVERRSPRSRHWDGHD